MTDEKPKAAKIFRKPIHDQATRKMTALPDLLKQSERPDGGKVAKVEPESGDAVDPTTSIDDGGLFDDLFDDEDEF